MHASADQELRQQWREAGPEEMAETGDEQEAMFREAVGLKVELKQVGLAAQQIFLSSQGGVYSSGPRWSKPDHLSPRSSREFPAILRPGTFVGNYLV